MTATLLKAGQVADQAGVTVQALRHYERLGLLGPVARTEGNHRLYGLDVVDRLRFIRDAQDVGLALAELGHVLGTERAQAARCAVAAELLRNRLRALDSLLHSLQMQRRSIARTLSRWEQEQKRGEAGHCLGHFCQLVESCSASTRSAKSEPGPAAAATSSQGAANR